MAARSPRFVVAATAFLLAAGSACGRKPGGLCLDDGQRVCADRGTMLACEDRRWQTYPCHGAGGCTGKTGRWASCDQTAAGEGDSCEGSVLACGADARTLLRCTDHRFAPLTACNGPKGCVASTRVDAIDMLLCDVDIAEAGAICGPPASVDSCSKDRGSALFCSPLTKRWEATEICRGTTCVHGNCTPEWALEGDPCVDETEDLCSEGGRAVLRCKDGKRSVVIPCDRGCVRAGTPERRANAFCRQGAADAGPGSRP